MRWLVILAIEADTVTDAFAKADDLLAKDFGGSDFDLYPAGERKQGDPLPYNIADHLSIPCIARPNEEEG